MGTSTNAILVYGIPLDSDSFPGYVEDADQPDPDNSDPDVRYWLGLSDDEKRLSRLAFGGDAEDGVVILTHCSASAPEYIVAIEDSNHEAARGYPLGVTGLDLSARPEWDKRLRAFVKHYGLTPVAASEAPRPIPSKAAPIPKHKYGAPGWYLCSYWGA